MNKKIIIILISIAVLSGVAAVLFTFFYPSQASDKLDGFAKCLASKNITMYGTPWCEWCQKEKANFKDAWRFINYIDCSKSPKDCLRLGIEETPTWIFPDGKRLTGYQGLEKLAKESGCELTTDY